MPNITAPALSFPTRSFPGSQAGSPSGVVGEVNFSELMGRYATLAKSQKLFYTSAIITAPVIFSTAGQLGPMIWNRTGSGLDAHVLAVGVGSPTTASSVAGAISWASNTQPTQPTSATALTVTNAYSGGGSSQMFAFSTATILVAPTNVPMPLMSVNIGATSVTGGIAMSMVDLGGMFVVPPGNIGYVCGNATLTSGVFTIGLLWAEIPN